MKIYSILCITLLSAGVFSCTRDLTQAQLRQEYNEDAPKAQELFNKAQAQEQKGDKKDAAKIYDDLALKYPSFSQSADSSYKAAKYWEDLSEPRNAFKSYQYYITTYRNGKNYKSALERQSAIAFMAARGDLKDSFLGMKTEPEYNEVVGLLENVRDNAPASDLAARSQFAIGTYSERKEKLANAAAAYFKLVDTYPSHPLAPEANLRAGKMLAGFSESGNQNSSNLQQAKNTMKDLIQQYPSSTQAKEAKSLLSKIDGLDVQRTYEIAEFYDKKGSVSSAKYYYEEVLSKAVKGSDYHNRAQERLSTL